MILELLSLVFAWCFVYRIWSIYARSTTGMNMSKSVGGTRCVALSTRISHFYRRTQCRDLGGWECWEDGLQIMLFALLLVLFRSNVIRTLLPPRCVSYAYGATGTEIRPTRILRILCRIFPLYSRILHPVCVVQRNFSHPMMAFQRNLFVPL